MENKQNQINIYIKIGFIIASLFFAMPSIIYLLQKGTVLQFGPYFQFLYELPVSRISQTFLYLVILAILSILYFVIIKRRENIFQNNKKMFIFIILIAIIFTFVLPFASSDIFYYLGIGRLDSTYHQNPYYTTIKEFVDQGENTKYLQTDTVLAQGYINDWSNTTVVYGAVWTLICKIIATFSFGNINVGVFLFKLVNVIIHIINCILIYKITNKKIFVLLYGLNPLILIEGIAEVHNDIFVVLFILTAMYFLVKRKNLKVAVVFLALATAIKYFAILLLPFMILYYFRQEKPMQRFIRCIQYGGLFLLVFVIPYLLYIQDMQVFDGLSTQQGRIAKSFYVIIMQYFQDPAISVDTVKNFLLGIFVIIYFFTCITLLNKKTICLHHEMKKANYFIMAFLFLLITNFQIWYIMWLFPLLMWQKAEDIKLIVQISLIAEFANSVFLTYGEDWQNGTPFAFLMVTGVLVMVLYNTRTKKGGGHCGKISIS